MNPGETDRAAIDEPRGHYYQHPDETGAVLDERLRDHLAVAERLATPLPRQQS